MSILQSAIDNYFANHWNGGGDKWSITNVKNISSKIRDSECVLDVGCGYNPFKDKLLNLYAFDPAINCGDEMCSLEDFDNNGELWDVILCMGSINFGTIEHIHNQVAKIVSILEPGGRIYWRQNPGHADHNNEQCNAIPFFPWDIQLNYKLAEQYGCTIRDIQIDHHRATDRIRIYAEWIKQE
jgi:hypothetical protein